MRRSTLFATDRAVDAQALLDQFGLMARRRSVFASLSGGERQRLFLVLALLNRPELVILDELTQGLDPAARRGVWAAVEQLHELGTTVLLVTHELDEAEALCGRVIAMRDGLVLDQGTPAELVARHAAWATVRFSAPPEPLALQSAIAGLTGVRDVLRCGPDLVVHGDRQVIARVGAELVRHDYLPDDLRVDIPDLEAALLSLLAEPAAPAAVPAVPSLIGAHR